MGVEQLRRPKLAVARNEFERSVGISPAEENAAQNFLDVLEVGFQDIEQRLPLLERKECFDRFDMPRFERVGAREIRFVPRLGQIR